MLKLIPQEPPAASRKTDQGHQKSSTKKSAAPSAESATSRVRLREKNVITVATHQLKEFIKDPEKASYNQMSELVHSLQRSILWVQKEKQQRMRKKK